jgi:hypothetical protein
MAPDALVLCWRTPTVATRRIERRAAEEIMVNGVAIRDFVACNACVGEPKVTSRSRVSLSP